MALILIQSPKGGVGVTTLVANLASWLARGGRQVLAVDFSPYEGLALHLRNDLAVHGAIERRPEDAAPRPGGALRLADRSEGWTTEQLMHEMERALDTDPAQAPLVIADVPAGDPLLLDRLVDRALIRLCVLSADAGSAAMLPMLMAEKPLSPEAPRILYVLNKMDDRRSVAQEFHRLLRAAVGDDLVAVIRADEAVNEALAALGNVYDTAPASAAAADMAGLADRIAASIDYQRTPQQEAAA